MDVKGLSIIILVSVTILAKKKEKLKPRVATEPATTAAGNYSYNFPIPTLLAYKPMGFKISFPDQSWIDTNTYLLWASVNYLRNRTIGNITGAFELDEENDQLVWKYKSDRVRLRNGDTFYFAIIIPNATVPKEAHLNEYYYYKVRIDNMNITASDVTLIKSVLTEHIKKHRQKHPGVLNDLINIGLLEFIDKDMRALIPTKPPPTTLKLGGKVIRPTFSWDD